MNTTIETILARKSVRNFNTQPVEREKLELIAKAGASAPSAMAKPVYVTIVTNQDAIQSLNEATKQVMLNSGNDFLVKMASDPNMSPLHGAPVIALLSDEKKEGNSVNCAVAAENILIAATSLGIASCYVAAPTMGFQVSGIKEKCGIPENQTVSAIVLLGYSDDKTPAKKHINAENIKYVY